VVRNPLLILAGGQRSGSTLLQRLLSSHPDVLIWGESGGALDRLLHAIEDLLSWSRRYGGHAREEYAQDGHQSWMANLNPSVEGILAAARRFVGELYAAPAASEGRSIWGLKEVCYGLTEARRLHRFFPDLGVILLIRDPRDMLCSLDEWERYSDGKWTRTQTEHAVTAWRRVAEDFAAVDGTQVDGPPLLRLRYEDVVADPEGTCGQLGALIGLDPARFDRSVFARRVHIGARLTHLRRDLRDWTELPASLRSLLDTSEVRLAAQACGYELTP